MKQFTVAPAPLSTILQWLQYSIILAIDAKIPLLCYYKLFLGPERPNTKDPEEINHPV